MVPESAAPGVGVAIETDSDGPCGVAAVAVSEYPPKFVPSVARTWYLYVVDPRSPVSLKLVDPVDPICAKLPQPAP